MWGTLRFTLRDKKADGTCQVAAHQTADFETISGMSKLRRIYAASWCNTAMESASCHSDGIVGDFGDLGRHRQFLLLRQSSRDGTRSAIWYKDQQVYAYRRLSETLYRGDFSGPEPLEKSNDVNSALRKGLRLEWEIAARNTHIAARNTHDALITGARGFASVKRGG